MRIIGRLSYSMRIFPRRRLWLAITGILVCGILFFGVLSVVFWLQFSSSAYFGEDEDIYVLAEEESATVKQSEVPLALAPALIKLPGIHVVSPELFIYGVLGDKAVIIRGIFPSDFEMLEDLEMVEGRWLQDRDIKGAVAGVNLARRLDLQVNDTYLISGSEVDDFITIKIVGIFQGEGMIDDDLLLNMKYARFLQQETREGYASIIRMRVDTSVWPDVKSVWRAVSGPPTVNSLIYSPPFPNNTEKMQISCEADSLNDIGSVVLLYTKAGSKRVNQKTMNRNGTTFQTQIGPIKDSSWINFWTRATDILGHESETVPINLSITDALGPDIFDIKIEPPPPQTKDHLINFSCKIIDTSELVQDVYFHTYNAGENRSIQLENSTGKLYSETLGRFLPGELLVWVTAKDRFGNPTQSGYYSYRILNRTDQAPPSISEIIYEPRAPHDNTTIDLSVRIVDESNVTSATLFLSYQVRGMHFNETLTLNRSEQVKDLYTAVTGPFPGSTYVNFRIIAKDEFGNTGYSNEKIFVRYEVPPEILDVYRFPVYSPPGINNLLFMNLYDASEITQVNITFLDRDRWSNLTIPVNITTFKDALYLTRLSPGTKLYSVAMIDRRGEVTRTPFGGFNSFEVDYQKPLVYDVRYEDRIAPGRALEVAFEATSSFPLPQVFITDSRGVISKCTLTESGYSAILGPYWEPGQYTFTITARDAGGNDYTVQMSFTVTKEKINDIDISPKPPLPGETVTFSCIVASSPGEVNLILPVDGVYARIPMSRVGSRWEASLEIGSWGTIPYLIEVRDAEGTHYSDTKRVHVEEDISLFIESGPLHTTSTDDIKIDLYARGREELQGIYIDYWNLTPEAGYRHFQPADGSELVTSFRPGVQLLGQLSYRVTVVGKTGNLSIPASQEEWNQIAVARNSFDPPEIIHQFLSPQTYYDLSGAGGSDFLVKVDALVRDEEGIARVWIEYEVDGRSREDIMLPGTGFYSDHGFYNAYLGPFPLNETIRARILATDIAGLTTSTPYFRYTLLDVDPPTITEIYHDPLRPSPEEEVTIGCEVNDVSGVRDVFVIYNSTEGEFLEPMDSYGNTYTLKVISPPAGQQVSYKIRATDNYGNWNETDYQVISSIDDVPPLIYEVTHVPEEPSDEDSVNITVLLVDHEDSVVNVTLFWYQYEWRWITKPGGKGLLEVQFHIDASEFDPGEDVRYKVEAFDPSGNKAVFPSVQQPEEPEPEPTPPPEGLGSGLSQDTFDPYLYFRIYDRTAPTLSIEAFPLSPNELETVSFSIGAVDNHLLRNLTLHVYVDDSYIPFYYPLGRPDFDKETDSGPLTPGGTVAYYLEAYDHSGNYARIPSSGNLSISVARLEWEGQIAVRDPRINLEVAGPAGFSEDMARQGAGKIITSINGILFMTFLATIAGIGNIIYSTIYRSKREIGILRTLGGSKRFLTILVGTLTVLVGLLAGLLGAGLAYLLISAFSELGATLAWVSLRPTFNVLILGATLAASISISLFGGMVALSRLFSYTPVESLRDLIPPAAKEEHPTYIEKTIPFPTKTVALLLLLLVTGGMLVRLYPTITSGQPFDPDSWLHLKASSDISQTGHIHLDYDSRELQAVAALPGLNILLVFAQKLCGTEMTAAKFLTPVLSSIGLVFVFVLGRRISGSSLVGGFACIALAFAGYYTNRTSALTKEAVALQLLLFCLFALYLGRTLQSRKFRLLVLVSSIALMLTHHLTAIYFILVLSGYLALVNLQKYSKGSLDVHVARNDLVLFLAVIFSFLIVTLTIGRYETQIPFQDALLILSLFFVTIGAGRLLLASSFMDRHRGIVTLAVILGITVFPFVAYRAGLFDYAPWEQVVPMLAPHLIILGFSALAIFPLSILDEENKGFLLAWVSAIFPFLMFGIVKRDLFGYILLFRNISYGYQLASVLMGISLVYLYKRFEWGRESPVRSLIIVLLTILVMMDIGLASYMGFLSQDYERKDLYHHKEVEAALLVNASTLRGQLVGADERARRLLLYITGEDGDQLTTYVYLIRMEKWMINRLRDQFEMTERPLTHVFIYGDMFRVGFIDSVLFQEMDRAEFTRYEDVMFDNGDQELVYVARKEWP